MWKTLKKYKEFCYNYCVTDIKLKTTLIYTVTALHSLYMFLHTESNNSWS